MAISIVKNSGKEHYGIQEYFLDTPDDLVDLPEHDEVGSSAFIISTGQVFMINSHGEWVEI